MSPTLIIAQKEIRDNLRNRWVLAATILMFALALALGFMGSTPTGSVKVDPLTVTVVSLSSLSIFLVPLIAMLMSYDAIIGEIERGTMALLLSYPISRWQILVGKFIGHTALLAIATLIGYGAAGLILQWQFGGFPAAAPFKGPPPARRPGIRRVAQPPRHPRRRTLAETGQCQYRCRPRRILPEHHPYRQRRIGFQRIE